MKHIFEEGEMGETSVILKSPTIGSHGRNYPSIHYYLGIIISLGYCMKSFIATSFQCGATEGLKNLKIKGFIRDIVGEKSGGGINNQVERYRTCRRGFYDT